MSTLFVVQNDTHAKNFNILANEAVERGEVVSILLLDGATHESTRQFFDEGLAPFIHHVERTGRAFYRSGSLSRVRICWQFRSWAHSAIGLFDHVVIGNDGALQKIIVRAARNRNAGCRVSVILDGLLTREKGIVACARRSAQRVAEHFCVDDLLPSTVGVSRLIDDITVMHESVAEVLRYHGAAAQRITVAPLPRHAAIRATAQRNTSTRQHVLFLGSAYLWHNESAGHARQIADFSAFSAFAAQSAGCECRLRIHPRDDLSGYQGIAMACVQVSDGKTSLEEDLAWADTVVASRSSGLFDATLAGKRALVYTAHFSAPEDDSFLGALSSIATFEELE